MAAVCLGEKTLKQQSIEQALRRLKYSHTSLIPAHEAGNTKQSKQKVGQFLGTKRLQPAGEERVITIPERTSKEQCFLSLEPKIVKRTQEKEKTRVKLDKQDKKAIRTGRALLESTIYEIAASKTGERKLQFKVNRYLRTSTTQTGRVQSSKSAPGTLCTVGPYKCVQCFANDYERSHKKQRTKQYYTNMKINRVAFSARPSGPMAKSTRKKNCKDEMPKSGFFNGWGVRCKTESPHRRNRANDSKCNEKDALDVTAGLKTLKLETWTERMRKVCNEERISQPPPTPVRQIAIRLPQGQVVKYQLSEDE